MKNWLRGKKSDDDPRQREFTVDELLTLGRPEEARSLLEEKLRTNMRDRRAQAKLGDVLLAMHLVSEALDMYEGAAQGYASDGFHDKAKALLHKMLKIAPNHEKAIVGLEQLDRAKERERRRQIVVRQLGRRGHSATGGPTLDVFRVNQLWKTLSRSSVLEALDTTSLGRLFEQFELREVAAGGQIAARGDRTEELYLVATGKVEAVEVKSGGSAVVLRTYEPGDVFGERSLLEHRPWCALYRAAGPCRLLCLSAERLAGVLPGLEDPRALLDALRKQRHDGTLAAMVRTGEEQH